jgi:hypothetical protein
LWNPNRKIRIFTGVNDNWIRGVNATVDATSCR